MALQHYTATMTGAALRLSTLMSEPHLPLRQIIFTNDASAAAVVCIGHAGVSTADYGIRLPAGTTTPTNVSLGPFESGAVNVEDIYLIGTNNEKVHVTLIPH